MHNEDNEFFILVLGVLAAIIMVVSWWYTSGGTAAPVTVTTPTESHEQADDPGDDHSDDLAGDDQAGDPDAEFEQATGEEGVAGNEGDIDDEDSIAADTVAADDVASGDGTASDGINADADLPASLLDALLADPDLSVITSLLREEGLGAALSATDGEPLTVFAPTNDAISDAAGSDTTVAVLEGDRAGVLNYHVVPGSYTFEALTELARGSRSATLPTLQGEPLSLSLEGESIVINGHTVHSGNSQTTAFGVVHTLDNVLVPPVAALNTLVEADPILFASGSATIDGQSFPTLDQFIELLAGNEVNLSIEGHTDSSGDPILNQNLSQSRARSVLNYLVANGIDESRLSAIGFGSSSPVADNDSEEGRALNRRIEFTLN